MARSTAPMTSKLLFLATCVEVLIFFFPCWAGLFHAGMGQTLIVIKKERRLKSDRLIERAPKQMRRD